jgi:hypothetical protein
MTNVIETWGKDNPVKLTIVAGIAGAILGALISFYPVDSAAYTRGRDAGVAATETSWQKKVDTVVADKVKEQVPIAFKKELDDANAQVTAKDATIKEKDATIKNLTARAESLAREIQQVRQDADRKTAIYDLFDNLVRQANAVADKFATGNSGRARANFRALLTQIHEAHERGSRWTGLFDNQATQLYDRLQRNEEVSDREIVAFLAAFSSDPAAKRRIVDDLAQLGVEARVVRD